MGLPIGSGSSGDCGCLPRYGIAFLKCTVSDRTIVGNKKSEAEAAERIVTRALEIAAEESGMNIYQLKSLPQGSKRRHCHDDTTAVIMYL